MQPRCLLQASSSFPALSSRQGHPLYERKKLMDLGNISALCFKGSKKR